MSISRVASQQEASPAHSDPADSSDTYVQQLQSRNEELQVLIEELMVSNEELRQRVSEVEEQAGKLKDRGEVLDRRARRLDKQTRQLQKLKAEMETASQVADIGIVFVDRQLKIRRFAGSADEVFHLRTADLGRPLADLNHELGHDRLIAEIEQVIEGGEIYEERVLDGDEKPYLLRLRPYHKGGKRTDGAVISFTGIKALEELSRRLAEVGQGEDAQAREKIQRLERELLEIQQQERRRLSQELHDGISSQVTGISMILKSYIERTESGVPVTAQELRKIKTYVDEAGGQLQQVLQGLHPVELDERSLPDALEVLADNMDGRFSGTCRFAGPGGVLPLEMDVATHLFRIAQEAANNALRHSGTSRVSINLERENESLLLRIIDDGMGFDVENVASGGIGLDSMRYRAELMGAKLTIDSVAGEGTTVHCRLPMGVGGAGR